MTRPVRGYVRARDLLAAHLHAVGADPVTPGSGHATALLAVLLEAAAAGYGADPGRVPLTALGYLLTDSARTVAYLDRHAPGNARWRKILTLPGDLVDPGGPPSAGPWEGACRLAGQAVGTALLTELGRAHAGDHVIVLPEWGGELEHVPWHGLVTAVGWPAWPNPELAGGAPEAEPDLFHIRVAGQSFREASAMAAGVLLDPAHHNDTDPARVLSQARCSARLDLRIAETILYEDRAGVTEVTVVLTRRVSLYVVVPAVQQVLGDLTSGPCDPARLRRARRQLG